MAVDEQYLNEYEGDKLIAICALFIILETTFVALRYYARHLTPAGLGWDDAIIPVAWLTNIGLCILCINAVHHAGVGRHLAYVLKYHPTQFESWGKSLYALEWLYLTSVALPKLSVLCFFLRVFTRRDARLTCYVLIGFVTATWAAYILAANLKCRPLAYQWDKHIPGGYCANIEAYYKTTSVPNIVTDLVIIMLPVPTVIALKTTLVRKVGLLCVFLVGSVGLIGSCVRMSTFFTHDAFTDNTWESVYLMGWSVIEPGMYLIAACLLALRPILRRMSPKEMRTKLQNKIALHGSHHSKSDTSHTSSDKTASVAMDWFKGREHRERSASEELVFPPAAYLNHPPSKSLDAEQGPVSSVYV